MKRSTTSEKILTIINVIVLGILGFLTLYPFIYIASISLSGIAEASKIGFHLYPENVTFESYKMVLESGMFYKQYFNTIVRTVGSTTLALLVTSLYAYPLSRREMPNKKFFINFALFTMLFGGGAIPTYLNMRSLGLIDNFLVLILPSAISAYNFIIIKSFFEGIPQSLIESAQVDGANQFTILFKIVYPISLPVLCTVGLWVAVANWNAWYDAMIYINTEDKQVVQNLLRKLIMETNSEFIDKGIVSTDVLNYSSETIKAATTMTIIVPILCVYPFIQKYFVKGVTLGAVKG